MPRFLLLLAFAITCITARAATPVTVAFDSGSPPFFMETRTGQPIGIYPSIIGAIFKDAGEPVNFESAPFNRVLANLDRGVWGAGGILKTPERLAKYDYSDYIFIETLAVYYSKKNPIHFTKLSDLRGKRIGVLYGWSYGETFDIAAADLNIKVERVAADEINFRKLQTGRLDAVLVLEDVGKYLMKSGRFDELEESPVYFRQNPSYIAFSKNAGRRPLLDKLNRSIEKIRQSGQIREIIHAYLEQADRHSK